jgi:hypothetical protein
MATKQGRTGPPVLSTGTLFGEIVDYLVNTAEGKRVKRFSGCYALKDALETTSSSCTRWLSPTFCA